MLPVIYFRPFGSLTFQTTEEGHSLYTGQTKGVLEILRRAMNDIEALAKLEGTRQ